MMKIVIVSFVTIVFLVAMFLVSITKGPDLSQYKHLLEPRITTMEDQRVLVVEAVGDPDKVGEKAFALLFGYYIKLDGVPKGRQQPAPRARLFHPQDTPRERWSGLYALPVPKHVTALPEKQLKGYRIGSTIWEYGEMAEILHVGPYSKEEPTIVKLRKFVEDRGYIIHGAHEEEYLRSPVVFFEMDPDKYYTIIRYPVKRAEENAAGS
jgi:effector-binding domain-containing protein